MYYYSLISLLSVHFCSWITLLEQLRCVMLMPTKCSFNLGSHTNLCLQTLAHWMTNIITDAGVDTSMFHQHSTRIASAAWLETGTKKMSLAQICRQAQWSNLTTTYRKFYHKVVFHTEQSQKSSEWAGWRWEVVITNIFLD